MPLLTGQQRKQLLSLLEDAFPRREDMEMVLFTGEFKSFDSYAKTGAYESDLVRLLEKAESGGWTRRLLAAIQKANRANNPGNPDLNAFLQEFDLSPEALEQEEQAAPRLSTANLIPLEQAQRAYLDAVIQDNRPLRLAGLADSAGDPTTVRLSLEDIYVTLNTRTMVDVPDRKKNKSEDTRDAIEIAGREKSRPLSAIEALLQSQKRRMVLLGLPGTGKSTFVRYLALRLAQEMNGAPRNLEHWQDPALLPVAISLGRFSETLPTGIGQGSAADLENFLQNTLEADSRGASAFAPHILTFLKDEGGLVMFDGLDEVADLSLRPVVVQAVEGFVDLYAKNPNSRFLITCRTYSYQDAGWQLTGWPVHELALLDPQQIEQFVQAWYDQHSLLDPARELEYAEKRVKLLARLRPGDPRRLYEVAPYPIILTIMAIVHASYELPDSRAQVYMQCVELLLEKWQTKRTIMGRVQNRSLLADLDITAGRIYQALYEIAFEAHRGREDKDSKAEGGSLVTGKLVNGVMMEHLQDAEKLKIFLDFCESANGLLMLQGTIKRTGADPSAPPRRVYTFPHLTFEEYLAGRHLENEDADLVRELLDAAYDRWVEVVKLLAEYLCFARTDRSRMNGLLEALSTPFPPNPAEKDWRALWLAGELLLLYRRAISKPSPYQEGIVQNLRRLVQTSALNPRERADAADVLDQLWQPDDLHAFVEIDGPSGSFSMAKYPVTNAQYARFLTAENFANRDLWCGFPKFSAPDPSGRVSALGDWGEAGWQWLQQELADEDNLIENGVLYPRYWRDLRFGIARPSAPVVGVSWWEANAYCRWLQAHWDALEEGDQGTPRPRLLRLPTEPEWELVAGGTGPQGRYAWDAPGQATAGLAEILLRANIYESQIQRTTPVWMYPQGVSPAGVLDLTGNVWEWQANFQDKDQDWISLRGGSWSSSQVNALVANRFNDRSLGRGYNIGFRVVSPPA